MHLTFKVLQKHSKTFTSILEQLTRTYLSGIMSTVSNKTPLWKTKYKAKTVTSFCLRLSPIYLRHVGYTVYYVAAV